MEATIVASVITLCISAQTKSENDTMFGENRRRRRRSKAAGDPTSTERN
jgi:hypothetical protein